MKIINVPIGKLKAASYNPRIMTAELMEALEGSIDRWTMVRPLVVNHDNTVIGGHQRLKAAKSLGLKTVPCVYVKVDKDVEMALNIALNKIKGQMNPNKLGVVLDELSDELRKAAGYSDDEIQQICGKASQEIDEVAEELEYADGSIKQVVLYFSGEEFDDYVHKLEVLMKNHNKKDFTEIISFLIDQWLSSQK